MLNTDIGSPKSVRGRTVIETRLGGVGHAIYGPYVPLSAGDYCVEFRITPIDLGKCRDNEVVATVDVACDYAREVAAVKAVTAGDLRNGKTSFPLCFTLFANAIVEYRVGVDGNTRLEIDGYCPVIKTIDPKDLESVRFLEIGDSMPSILRNFEERFRHFYEQGFTVHVEHGDVIMQKDNIRFYVRTGDDLNLIEEIFIEKVYRFESVKPTVIVDVGMNIGLVSMQFAANDNVERVYSFEPFASTYDRAIANLSLNPDYAAKIVASNTGIGEVDGKVRFSVFDTDDSGSRSTRDTDGEGGVPIELDMQSASAVIERIAAAEPGRSIVMKVDCEGAEFGIFETLERSGVLNLISAFMVEWHTVFPGKSQADLIAPLLRAGFMVFDRSPPLGNGFFYAVRQA